MRAKSWVPGADDPPPPSTDPWAGVADHFANQTIPVSEFYNDPVGFCDQFIDFEAAARGKSDVEPGLTDYQREIMAAVPVSKRVAVRGPHGLGKTTTNALTVIWFAITRDDAGVDWKCATTAGAWRQLEKYLWPEIAKWSRFIRWDRLGMDPWRKGKELMTLSLSLKHGEAFAVASSDKQKIEGVHADAVLYIFDESKAIAADIFDAAEGAFSGAKSPEELAAMSETEARGQLEALAVATSTPGEPSGRFYDIHAKKEGFEDWKVFHVTLKMVMKAGRVSEHWRGQREKQWGKMSQLYHNRVLGEFYSSADDATVPLAWFDAAVERWYIWQKSGRRKRSVTSVLGVDVALGGADFTAIARRRGDVLEKVDKLITADTLEVAAATQVRMGPGDDSVVDSIGVGAGVITHLRQAGVQVRPFNAANKSHARDRSGDHGFANKRAEMWWHVRELLDPAFNPTICMPPDEDLLAEIVAPKWSVTKTGKIQIESKADVKERIGHSTDTADAVLQTWASPDSVDDHADDAFAIPEPAVRFATVDDINDLSKPFTGSDGAVSFGDGDAGGSRFDFGTELF